MIDQGTARKALRAALEVRKKAKVAFADPVCVYDVAEKLGVEVRFFGGGSFGGMYAKETQTILVPTERPAGRRAFTCAHELGHWYFGHGTKVEDLVDAAGGASCDPEEQLADHFAGHLLMPKWAIAEALKNRRLDPSSTSAQDLYCLACLFGVGYETIITHLWLALGLLPRTHANELLKHSPKSIIGPWVGDSFPGRLLLVDQLWKPTVPIDLEVGDGVGLSFEAKADDKRLSRTSTEGPIVFVANQPGVTRIVASEGVWATFVRISRKGFTGRSIYRHLEDPDV